jgi:hypothetical protein
MYVVRVSQGCCKSRSRYCTCCNGLYTYVSSVCSKCFVCFRRILQVFYLDIAKLDWDVAYIYICKCFMCFHIFFNGYIRVFKFFLVCLLVYVASVSSRCCKSRLSVAHIAMHVSSGGGASGPCARSGGAGPTWAREMQAQAGAC